MKDSSSNRASGAGASETSSRKTSRSGLPRDLRHMRRAKHGDNLIDEAKFILRKNSEGIANAIVNAALREIELDVPSVFLRPLFVEASAREKHRLNRIVARASGRGRRRRRTRRGRRQNGLCRRFVQLLGKRFEHAGSFLAARRAEIEARLLARRQGVCVVIAIIAALTAILLGHRRHHASTQRAPFRKLHALVNSERLIVPGRGAVIGVAIDDRGVLFWRERCDAAAVLRDESREKTIQPGSLFGREGRRLGNDLDERRWRDLVHWSVSASARRLIASMS